MNQAAPGVLHLQYSKFPCRWPWGSSTPAASRSPRAESYVPSTVQVAPSPSTVYIAPRSYLRAPNLLIKILPTKIRWLKLSGKFPMNVIISPLNIEILLESNPLKSRSLVRRLAVAPTVIGGQGRRTASTRSLPRARTAASSSSGPSARDGWVSSLIDRSKSNYVKRFVQLCIDNTCI